jgi:hypothetical protein
MSFVGWRCKSLRKSVKPLAANNSGIWERQIHNNTWKHNLMFMKHTTSVIIESKPVQPVKAHHYGHLICIGVGIERRLWEPRLVLRECFVLHIAAPRCWMPFEYKQMRRLKVCDVWLNVLHDVLLECIQNLPTYTHTHISQSAKNIMQ